MTTTTKTKRDYTIAKLGELIEKEFQAYGFRARNIVSRRQVFVGGAGRPTGSIEFDFDKEMATGMAAFSQVEVQVKASVYLGAALKSQADIKPWDIWKIDTLSVLDSNTRDDVLKSGLLVTLEVNYTHPDGGSNGKSIRYAFDGERLTRERR